MKCTHVHSALRVGVVVVVSAYTHVKSTCVLQRRDPFALFSLSHFGAGWLGRDRGKGERGYRLRSRIPSESG